MAKMEITKTELFWPGKYSEDGTLKEVPRVNLPFQVIETVNESRATREAKKGGVQSTLFDVYEGKEGDTFEAGWRNKLIWGDNLLVMGSLLEKFAGKIDLIYIDPPFATGADFTFTTEIGESGLEIEKEQSAIEEKAYRDTWGRGTETFVQMMYDRLMLMRDLLAPTGSIYVHCDWRVTQFVRMSMDDIFGRDHFRNEIIWCYKSGGAGSTGFAKKHDTIYYYTKTDKYVFNPSKEKSYMGIGYSTGNKNVVLHDDNDGLGPYTFVNVKDWWSDIGMIATSKGRLYPTQKPDELLDRIIASSSERGGIVADFFGGSGTTLSVAEKLGRRWIGCDLGRWAIHVTRKRLLGIENCKPFEVLNLGKYERQYWQGVTFAKNGKTVT
ncbi:MAG TPA: site-specific DNA-methyltransferase, partial [Smithellaceae bacterium]|nr:site-specific DNA-methyltransferase [Smithellaceae bacterium]